MDRLLYVAMSGASRTLQAQATISHNIANASTAGFKAALVHSEAAPVAGPGLQTRVHAQATAGGFDASAGQLQHTGQPLDLALRPGMWLAVQAADGSEAYTRAGDLQLDPLGQLQTRAGQAVLGTGGAVGVPPAQSITVGADGTLSIVPLGLGGGVAVEVDTLRVVAEPPGGLERGADGLFRPAIADEAVAPAGPGDLLLSGALEASNVNVAGALVEMIAQQRQFETQVQLMKKADENAQRTAELLRLR